jgi:aspartate/methionine/tyrosine aminotransferase
MERMVTWGLRNGLHVVSDEIYALSVFDEASAHPFVSVAQVRSQSYVPPP